MKVRRRYAETNAVRWDGQLSTVTDIQRLGIDFRMGRTTVRGVLAQVGFVHHGLRSEVRNTPVPVGHWVLRVDGATRVLSPEAIAVEWEPVRMGDTFTARVEVDPRPVVEL